MPTDEYKWTINAAPYKFILPVRIEWNPQPDITAYELARLIPLIISVSPIMPSSVPQDPNLLRHIIIHDPN